MSRRFKSPDDWAGMRRRIAMQKGQELRKLAAAIKDQHMLEQVLLCMDVEQRVSMYELLEPLLPFLAEPPVEAYEI